STERRIACPSRASREPTSNISSKNREQAQERRDMEINLNHVIEQVGRDKGIAKEVLVEALEAAMLTAARKKYGASREIEARFSPEAGEVELFEFKTVVEQVTDAEREISVEEAHVIDAEAELGDA